MDCTRKTWLRAAIAVASIALSGCAVTGPTASGPAPATGASATVNVAANTAQYQPMNYANAATKGPAIIVLPGVVKSNNATFSQRYGPNNIADYAELELWKANFQVLDRANLSSVLHEIELAYNLGDPAKAQALCMRGEAAQIDVGKANEHWFINAASSGFGAEITANTSPELKRLLGPAAYTVMGAIQAINLHRYQGRLILPGRKISVSGPVAMMVGRLGGRSRTSCRMSVMEA